MKILVFKCRLRDYSERSGYTVHSCVPFLLSIGVTEQLLDCSERRSATEHMHGYCASFGTLNQMIIRCKSKEETKAVIGRS